MKALRRAQRTLFYFKTGYATYVTLLIGSINMLTSTYFLAIDKIPFVSAIFPTFDVYVLTIALLAIPIITVTGLTHFKIISGYSSAMSIQAQNDPFQYRFSPGFTVEVFGPAYRILLKATLNHACGTNLSNDDMKELCAVKKRLNHLINGGSTGKYFKGVIDD